MKHLMLACLAGMGTLAQAQAIDEFSHAVAIDAAGTESFYRLVVPQAAYEGAAHADLRDLRVYNGNGEVVPHAFRSVEVGSLKPEPVKLAIFPLRGPRDVPLDALDLDVVRSGDRVSVRMQVRNGHKGQQVLLGYLLDASKLETPISGLRFRWGPGGAAQLTQVKIESSGDLKRWAMVVEDAPLGALSHAGQRLERNAVEFRPLRATYYRITWPDPSRAIELGGAEATLPEQGGQAERMWKEVAVAIDAEQPGGYAFDLGGRFPVDRLDIRLPHENTVAPVQVLSRADPKDKWRPVASSVTYRIRNRGQEVSSPALVVEARFDRYWLLRFDTKGGGIGAGVPIVRAGWSPRELVFNTRGGGPFRLAFGNPRAEPAALGLETLVPGLRTDQAPQIVLATTGTQEKLAGKAPSMTPADRKKWGLWAVLAGAVAVLGWMAWQLSRQMRSSGGQ